MAIELDVENIRTDGGTQPRASIDGFAVNEYAEAMERGDQFPPIEVVYDGTDYWLYDGFHRLRAVKKLGRDTIHAHVEQGTKEDAQWRSLGANKAHGLRRSQEDKQRAIKRALKGWGTDKSDRQIARHVGCSHRTVNKYRDELELSGQIAQIEEREVTRDDTNYTQDTSNIGGDGQSSDPPTPPTSSPTLEKPDLPDQIISLVKNTHVPDEPSERRRLANLDGEDQVEVARRVRNEGKLVKDAAKELRRDKQKEREQQAKEEAGSLEDLRCTVTDEQDAVACDAVITDPPYGILDEDWEPSDLHDFTDTWASRWAGCGADFIATFWSQEWLYEGREWFDEALDGYDYHQTLVWHCPNNKSPQSRQGFKQTWEPVLFYRRSDSEKEVLLPGGDWGDGINDFDCHVAAVPQSNFNDVNRKQHPAQKPLSVMGWLVVTLSEPGDLVADPFCGSGTTGVAAVKHDRAFHGIEIDDDHAEAARRRVATYG